MDAGSSKASVDREIELKLEIEPDGHALEIPQEARCRSQVTVYYETPDEALKKHGLTLRVRCVGDKFVQTVKPVAVTSGLFSREEFERPVRSIKPDVSCLRGTPLEAMAEAGKLKQLAPLIRSDVRRTTWTEEVGGAEIQFDLDQGEIHAADRSQRFHELELELLSGDPSCLLVAAKRLAERVPVRLGVLTKAERGAMLACGGFKKIAKAAPVEIDDSMTVAEAFEVMVYACLKHYRLNEPLVIRKRRAEALHQTRVAMRRLRSAFTLFKSAIEDVEYQYLREELRWFTGQLGDARNLDVYLQRDLPEADREGLQGRREQAYEQVIGAMDSRRFRALMVELVGWTAFGPWRSGKEARKPVGHYAERRLDRLWHSIVHVGHHVADLDEDTRHRLRIQVKKMRYAIEFLQGLYPQYRATEKRFADAIEELQESLGKLNDLATARTLVETRAAEDDWLIGEPEERFHLREAERAFRDLRQIGPFWRANHRHDDVVHA